VARLRRGHGEESQRELPEPRGLAATLRPYQRRGLAWLVEMTTLGLGGCLADDMGLGKTLQAIALHLHRQATLGPSAGPLLVVCPATVLGGWQREIERFAPGIPVRRFHGGDRTLSDVAADEVVLVTYGVLRRDRPRLAEVPWGVVVADEAQQVKNPLSRTARELRLVPASARVALTGTPVENRLSELWAILDWTTPGLLGPLATFQRRVAVPVERHRDPEATAALASLVRPFLLRRRKLDPGIAPELPPKTETDEVVPLTTEQASLYEAVVREVLADIAKARGMARRGLVLKLLTSLKQVCNHPAQLLHQDGPLAGRSGKLDALDQLLPSMLDGGESVLLFTQYVTMGRLLERHLAAAGIGTLFLHGGVPVARREQMVTRFQAGEVPVFLLSLKAGGLGLNLTRATQVVHYDRWWNPAVEDQASDRAWRIGQDKPVQVHRFVTEGTVEDKVAALLDTKRALADAVVGSGEAWLSELGDDELSALVTLRRTA
ncbi:MAG TPA: DEAD/DEAH box helicase, partial [Acidimicrobiales bacterium]|nr:DEAD/DEAH box helicase [Acidimicrobiales bacterium]